MKPQKEITVHRKMVVCESEDIRVVWNLDAPDKLYSLEVQFFKTGWLPLVLYDTKKEALAGMEALVAASRREMEYAEADEERSEERSEEE